jgi:hypothetical protein
MGGLATINIDRAVATAAADRAKQQGLTTEDYVSQLILRDMERELGETGIQVRAGSGGRRERRKLRRSLIPLRQAFPVVSRPPANP